MIFCREFAEIIQARVPEFCLAGKNKLDAIGKELEHLNYSPEQENKPLNYKIQVKYLASFLCLIYYITRRNDPLLALPIAH